MAQIINIDIGGTETISTSDDYVVTVNALSTLNVTGAGTVANLTSVAGDLLAHATLNVSGGATARFSGALDVGAIANYNIGPGGTLEFDSVIAITIGSSINFTGTGFGAGDGGTLKFGAGVNLELLNAPINGFADASNSIDYNAVADSATFTPGLLDPITLKSTGTLTLFSGGNPIKIFNLRGLPAGLDSSNFQLSSNGSGGTIVTFVCFVRGTRIATPAGPKAVEDLVVGDLVETLSGQAAPIKWIGKRTFRAADLPRPAEGMPIRIAKDAIAPNVPCADLLVSPGHCMYLEGSLIPAQFLVNGVTIVQDFDIEEVEYFHIELDKHAVIIAENAPAESYLDTGNRSFFANPGVVQLFPNFAPKSWDNACAPFVTEGPVLKAAKEKLLARAKELGMETTDDPALRLRVDGRDIGPISVEGAVYTFALPRTFSDVQVVSRANAPAEVYAAERDDRRRLGVALARVVLRHGSSKREIPVDHPSLTVGFHGVERHAGFMWRWSDGEGLLPRSLTQIEGQQATAIEIHVHATLPAYRVDAAATETAKTSVRIRIAA